MLFNLSTQKKFKHQQQAELAIGGLSHYGPVFKGDGDWWELGVYEQFNGEDKCVSWANESGYKIGV